MTIAKNRRFLLDVLFCSLGAFGGPQSHYAVFEQQLIRKRSYVDEAELLELMALCAVLPGPTSTQTIVAIGYKLGGTTLALWTMIVWILPIAVFMAAMSFAYEYLSVVPGFQSLFRFLPPMAAGFISVAAWKIGSKVISDRYTAGIFVVATIVLILVQQQWMFPLLLLAGGLFEMLRVRPGPPTENLNLRPKWAYLFVISAIALLSLLAHWRELSPLLSLFERFYRYGYLVFGGGQVVIPMMYNELVEQSGLLSAQEFLSGYGLVQGLPGPMFSFAAYAGGLASRSGGTLQQVCGAAVSALGIFLPGLLLIFFVYPLWADIRNVRAISVSIRGINAVAGGSLLSAAVIISFTIAAESIPDPASLAASLAAALVSAVVLGFSKIPPPLLVLAALLAGLLL